MKKELFAEEITLIKLAQEYSDETKARELLESMRWPKGPVCPHCKCDDAYTVTPKKTSKSPARAGLYSCAACRKQFTVTVGTIFEDSHLPISKWLMAMFILCSSKKSISAHQLHRMLDITYRSAWFMAHRIRYAMAGGSIEKLTGTVEVDETYVGGQETQQTRGSKKVPVVALVSRKGPMMTRIVPTVSQKNLRKAINECVAKSASLNTDESMVYRKQYRDYVRHEVVNHSASEYTRLNPDGTMATVNSCESFFSLLKRGVHGSWHHVSRTHLHRYAGEFAFRWTHRQMTDGDRMEEVVKQVGGKRLTYKTVTA
jgi:transposase-like protein